MSVEMADEPRFVQLELAPAMSSPRLARAWTAEVLREWDLTHGLDDVLLLVTELVTNAVLHARTPVTVELSWQGAQFRVAVVDASPVMPRVGLDSRSDDASGRGLLLVDRLADKWGLEPVDGGKSVWCVLRLDRGDSVRTDPSGPSAVTL